MKYSATRVRPFSTLLKVIVSPTIQPILPLVCKAVGVTSTFRRVFDEIEIWDGLPDYRLGGASWPAPFPPVGLKIAGRLQGDCELTFELFSIPNPLNWP